MSTLQGGEGQGGEGGAGRGEDTEREEVRVRQAEKVVEVQQYSSVASHR